MQSTLVARAFADHAMRLVLVDKRRAAARFLRTARGLLPNTAWRRSPAGRRVVWLRGRCRGEGGVGNFDGSVAMRFIDPGHRRAWAKNLDSVRENDREAREALALRARRNALNDLAAAVTARHCPGLTEFLPVSSTAHLILVSDL